MMLRTLLLTALLLAVAGAPAHASCVPSTYKQRLGRADAVFVGRVLSVSANGASAKFRVLSVTKGPLHKGSTVLVLAKTYPSSITIDWKPRAGQRWRIYAARAGLRWITNDCMGSHRL